MDKGNLRFIKGLMMMFPQRTIAIAIAVTSLAWALCAGDEAKPTDPKQPYVAEVTGDNVHVRSGPSTNYYPVAKLHAGVRVTVVDEEQGWLGIVPPESCFSLIKDTYVDRDRDESIGVVKGDRVNVRAGSTMSGHKYAVQLQLSKGAEIKIIGEHDDGFLRIVPPKGTKLWIFAQYLQRVPGLLLKMEADTVSKPPSKPDSKTDDIRSSVSPKKITVPAMTSAEWEAKTAELRAQLQELEAKLKEEMAKPLFTRELLPLAERYRPLAEQAHDEYTHYYARTRVSQLEDLAATIESVQKAGRLYGTVAEERSRFAAERGKIKTVHIRTRGGFAAQGELRESAIYDSPVGPRRLRLIDPTLDATRTVCYVEIPRDSRIDVAEYLGRMVGVCAKTKRLKTDSMDPVPIIVAEELVLLGQVQRMPEEAAPGDSRVTTQRADEP